MSKQKASLNFDGITYPIQARGLARKWTTAAVKTTTDDLVLGIIVRRLGIFVHVEACEALSANLKRSIVWRRKALEKKSRIAFPIVEPINSL